MYRRYQATPSECTGIGKSPKPSPVRNGGTECGKKTNEESKKIYTDKTVTKTESFFTKLIPQSLYNPETGKVFGILSTEDLFLIALIILMIDSGDGDEDNSMLIYALIYILISGHMDLPF